MSSPSPAIPPRVWWTIASAALIVTVAMGVRQAFGLFLSPVSTDLEIGRQAFGLAIALNNLMFGLAQPFVGAYADKHGAGRVVALSAVIYAVGLGLTTLIGDALGLNLTLGALVGLALSGTTFVVVLGAVGRVVAPERRSLAFGVVTAGGSLGQFLVVPAASGLLDALGWHGAMLMLAAFCVTMVGLSVGVAGKPQAHAPAASTPATDSLKAALVQAAGSKSYWLLNAGFFVCGFHIAFVGTHLPAFLRDGGLDQNVGAWCLALIGLFNILGSWLWGAWGGRRSKKRLLSALYFSRAVAVVIFIAAPLSVGSALTFAAVFGFLWLGTVPLTSGLVAQIWGARYLSTLYGIVFLSHQIGSFLGAWLGGLAFDATGSYLSIWLASIALGLFAAAVHWPIDERAATPLPQPAPAE
ncbi:MFS transporter [Caulobacter sp. 17J80-11]|uniref:MFS transporter n=1 Tax=Caulobacter sp. 17J80-11 TaxID=2763502 RepID=UPI001CA4495A|nr:MFS transporter [Caulobacter sp. 17J80-11]